MSSPVRAPLTPVAHGLGGPTDLPLAFGHVLVGAGFTVALSFVVLALARRTPRRPAEHARPAPAWVRSFVDSRAVRGVVVTVSLLLTAWIGLAACFGEPTVVNPTFGAVFVLLWVGIVPLGVCAGPVYRLANPWRWVHRGVCRVTGRDHRTGPVGLPDAIGVVPAAFTLFAFVWLELTDPDRAASLAFVRGWFLVLAVVLVVGALVFGDDFFARADPFEVFSTLAAGLSPWGRRDGVLVVRSPLASLDAMPHPPGLVLVVSVLFGSTCFDAFRESSPWLQVTSQVDDPATLNTAALAVVCLAVAGSLTLASVLLATIGRIDPDGVAEALAPTLVPIVVGYTVAHYLSYFISGGLMTLQQLGDPLTRGWPLAEPLQQLDTYAIYAHPELIAVVKMTAVVVGHVVGVVAAHERSLQLLARPRALLGQLPMMALMIIYTVGGLWLLFSG